MGLSCSKTGYNTNWGLTNSFKCRVKLFGTYTYSCPIACLNFLLILSLKTIKNSNRQIRQLYAYFANKYTLGICQTGLKDIKILKCFPFDVFKTCIYTSNLLNLRGNQEVSIFTFSGDIANDNDMLLNLCGNGWRPRFSVLRFLLPFWVLYRVLESQTSSVLKFLRSFHLWP